MVSQAFLRNFAGCGLTLVISGCLFTASSCRFLGSVLQTPFSRTQPSSTAGDTQLRLGCAGLWHRPRIQFTLPCLVGTIYFVLFSRLSAASPSIPLKVPFCPSWFPHCEGSGFSECGNFSSLLSPCQNYWFLFWFLFSFFVSFFWPNCEAIFLVLLGIWSLLLIFSRCSVKLFHL